MSMNNIKERLEYTWPRITTKISYIQVRRVFRNGEYIPTCIFLYSNAGTLYFSLSLSDYIWRNIDSGPHLSDITLLYTD